MDSLIKTRGAKMDENLNVIMAEDDPVNQKVTLL